MSRDIARQHVDPEAAEILKSPELLLPTVTDENYPVLKEAMAAPAARELAKEQADARGLQWEDHTIDGPRGPIELTVIRPAGTVANAPLYFGIHGGGMILADRFSALGAYDEFNWITEHNMVVVTTEYRLAPEHPAPAGVEDCYAGLLWAVSQASAWGVDPDKIIIGGGSGGGGLAAGVALMARDKGEVNLFAQCLIYPMIDDRNTTVSSQQYTEGHGHIWPRESNTFAWNALLGEGHADRDDISPYVVPARAVDLSGLPTTYIDVGSAEVFRDEDIKYALRLLEAGVQTELHVWRGGYHGYDTLAVESEVAKATTSTRSGWMRRILRG